MSLYLHNKQNFTIHKVGYLHVKHFAFAPLPNVMKFGFSVDQTSNFRLFFKISRY